MKPRNRKRRPPVRIRPVTNARHIAITELGIAQRVVNALDQNGVVWLQDLLDCKRDELLTLPNFGGAVLEEIQRCLLLSGISPPAIWQIPAAKPPVAPPPTKGRRGRQQDSLVAISLF